jgi:hypothetical protein
MVRFLWSTCSTVTGIVTISFSAAMGDGAGAAVAGLFPPPWVWPQAFTPGTSVHPPSSVISALLDLRMLCLLSVASKVGSRARADP